MNEERKLTLDELRTFWSMNCFKWIIKFPLGNVFIRSEEPCNRVLLICDRTLITLFVCIKGRNSNLWGYDCTYPLAIKNVIITQFPQQMSMAAAKLPLPCHPAQQPVTKCITCRDWNMATSLALLLCNSCLTCWYSWTRHKWRSHKAEKQKYFTVSF